MFILGKKFLYNTVDTPIIVIYNKKKTKCKIKYQEMVCIEVVPLNNVQYSKTQPDTLVQMALSTIIKLVQAIITSDRIFI